MGGLDVSADLSRTTGSVNGMLRVSEGKIERFSRLPEGSGPACASVFPHRRRHDTHKNSCNKVMKRLPFNEAMRQQTGQQLSGPPSMTENPLISEFLQMSAELS